MSLPIWLPPLISDHNYTVQVDAAQYQPPSSLPPCPCCDAAAELLMIKLSVSITFISSDPSVSTNLQGLSLGKLFRFPLDRITRSTPSSRSRRVIAGMFNKMPIPFSLDRFDWSGKRFDGSELPQSLSGSKDDDVVGLFLNYILEVDGQCEGQSETLAIKLTMDKRVVVPSQEFERWIWLYNEEKGLSPSFEADYLRAIRRKWDDSEGFWEVTLLRCSWTFEGGDSGGEGEVCSICLEEFAVGSRVIRLPDCCHMYHRGCLIKWLRRTNLCPLCRADLSFQVPVN